ncbi:MAG TPA: hypothetical protein VLF90_00285 [Patescibacteria group bacterium]|nr:hypothetical protein [Patescibacteria group bacterium]
MPERGGVPESDAEIYIDPTWPPPETVDIVDGDTLHARRRPAWNNAVKWERIQSINDTEGKEIEP